MSCFSFVFVFSFITLEMLPWAFWNKKGPLAIQWLYVPLEFGYPRHFVFFFSPPPHEQITTLLLYLHTRLQDALYMQMPVHNELKRTFLRASRTLTSSLFSALKFIEKRHCFFKISLAVISGSVHCWRVNRKRVEIDIRGPKTSGAYHQRTSCSAGGSSSSSSSSRANKFLNASFFSRHG